MYIDSPRTTIALADERVFYTGDVSAFEEVVAGSDVEVVVCASVCPMTRCPFSYVLAGFQLGGHAR
jgi:hypothetical protein